MSIRSLGVGILLFCAPATGAPLAQSEPADTTEGGFQKQFNPTLHVSRAPGEIEIDGELGDPGWAGAEAATNFTEHSPGEEIEPPVDTRVYVTYDDENLYLSAVCFADPDKVRASVCERERIFNDDNIGFFFDTYGDGTRAYIININPHGIQYDAIWSSGWGEDSNFDLVFKSNGKVTDSGYQVEMAIPFKALRFPNRPVQEWRFDFYRHHQREVHYSMSWCTYDQDESCWPCQWGTVVGIREVRPGRGLELLASYVAQQASLVSDKTDPNQTFAHGKILSEPSLGGRYALTSDVLVEATYNPDFSQIEADPSQINVNSTFALLYDERRPFFQEGMDLFRSNFRAVYTRSINDPEWAAKASGKMGRTSVAALTARDNRTLVIIPGEEGSEYVPIGKNHVNMFAAQRSFGRDSYIKGIITDRRYQGGGSGSLASLNGSLRITKSLGIEGQFIVTKTVEPNRPRLTPDLNDEYFADGKYTKGFDGEMFSGTGALADVSWDSRKLYLSLTGYQRTPTYRTENGFQPQNSDRRIVGNAGLHFRPQGSLISRFDPWVNAVRIWNYDGLPKDEWVEVSMSTDFAFAQAGLWTGYMVSRERFNGVEFDNLWVYSIDAHAQPVSALEFGGSASYGQQIARSPVPPRAGMETRFTGWVDIRPTGRLLIETSLRHSRNRDVETHQVYFSGYIARTRLTYQFTRALSLRLVGEYDDFSKQWSLDPLLTYRLNPFSTFFAGATYDYTTLMGCGPQKDLSVTCLEKRQIFVKLQYLFQM